MKQVDKLYWIALVLSVLIMLIFWQVVDLHSLDDLLTHPLEVVSGYCIYLMWLAWLTRISHNRILRGPLFPKRDLKP